MLEPIDIPTIRRRYVKALVALADDRTSPHANRVGDSRRQMAQLRHSLRDGRQHHAYDVVFRIAAQQSSDGQKLWLPPTEHEQRVWVLVGGLFATHPLPWRSNGARSIGASMGRLDKKQVGSASRRFNQLLGRDHTTLPYHLRQSVQLLSAHSVPVHYGQLLDDLVTLLGPEHASHFAGGIRLRWAREFHLPATTESTDTSNDLSQDPETIK